MHHPGHELEQRPDVWQTWLRLMGQPLLLRLLLSLLLWWLCLAKALCSACRGDHLQKEVAELHCMWCHIAAMGETGAFRDLKCGCRGDHQHRD